MSDFLTNLAVRSSASAEALQPRLPSLFEPPAPPAGSLAMPSLSGWEQNRETSKETIPRIDSRKLRAKGPASDEAPRAEGVEAKPAGTPPAANTPGPVQASLPRRSETQADPVEPRIRPAVQTPSPSQIPVREQLASALPSRPEGHIAERSPRDASDHQDVIQRSLPASQERSEGPAARIESPDFPADRISQLVRSIIQPRVAPRSQDLRRGELYSRSNRSEPAIQVTIGRIEVRATTQPEPTPRERSASPVMSLDEYLRQKRAGA